jgi:hypothetical protein
VSYFPLAVLHLFRNVADRHSLFTRSPTALIALLGRLADISRKA